MYYVCSACLSVRWCQFACGTIETKFVYFSIVKWTQYSACFDQHSNGTNLHLKGQIDAI